MSAYSPEGSSDTPLDPEVAARLAREEREDDRIASSGGHAIIPGRDVPRTISQEAPARRVSTDERIPGRERFVPLTTEEVDAARQRLAALREQLEIGVVADLPPPVPYEERPLPEIPEPQVASIQTRRELGVIARQLAMETGRTHRVITDTHGRLIVEPVQK